MEFDEKQKQLLTALIDLQISKISGDIKFNDECEEIINNSFKDKCFIDNLRCEITGENLMLLTHKYKITSSYDFNPIIFKRDMYDKW